MKSLRYLCISLILLTISNEAVACWGPWYTPKGYYMYRVYNNLPDPTIDIEKQNPNEAIYIQISNTMDSAMLDVLQDD